MGFNLQPLLCQIDPFLRLLPYLVTYNEPGIGHWGELCLSGNHTVTEFETRVETYSQKSGWINHSNEQIFKVMTFK